MKIKINKTSRKIPSEYAETLGHDFISLKKKENLASLGQYFTPRPIAKLIADSFSGKNTGKSVKILDPGAGTGILSCLLCEILSERKNKPNKIFLTVYEIDKEAIPFLKRSLNYLKKWLASKKVDLNFTIHNSDFVLENAQILNQTLQPSLFDIKNFEEFDFVVANPPYFKISKKDPRAQAVSSIIHGQPNIYALFMAIAASLLKEGGELGFITPRSYASGLYFKKFRKHFFKNITPILIHIFQSRDKAFGKDKVLQENVILHAKKESGLNRKDHEVEVSSCEGLADIDNCSSIFVPLKEVMGSEDDYVLHIPTVNKQREVMKIVKSWKQNLQSLGLKVSTGPIVPFRAKDVITNTSGKTSVPLLWLHNVKTMQVQWPVESRKPKYVSLEAKRLLLPNDNYVLIRRFSTKEEKRRLVAAPLISKDLKSKFVGIENHLNYIYRQSQPLTEKEALGLAAIFNCSLLDTYFRIFNGSTQVNATELRGMPLPDASVIEKIGSVARKYLNNQEEMDKEIINLIKEYA